VNFEELHFPSNQTGWVVGSSRIFRTTNGGGNWSDQSVGCSTVNNSVWFVNDMTGWHVGSTGTIYKTTNGGESIVGITVNEEEIPSNYALGQNYPNPFNSMTTVCIRIPQNDNSKIGNGNYTLKVYDVAGREVSVLIDGYLNPGVYKVRFDASTLASGLYFYQLKSGEELIETRKMVLLK